MEFPANLSSAAHCCGSGRLAYIRLRPARAAITFAQHTFTLAMRLFILTLLAALVALATAGTVVINGVCRDCTPPDAETVVVGDKTYKGPPGSQGTVYISGQGPNSNVAPPAAGGHGSGANPYPVPEGYSGPVPGGAYVHNKDCTNCDIRA